MQEIEGIWGTSRREESTQISPSNLQKSQVESVMWPWYEFPGLEVLILGLHLWHMEAPRLGVELDLTATPDP